MKEKIKKIKGSKEQFAEVLYYWLSGFLTKKAIKKTAKELGFRIRNDEDFNKISNELFFLNMWLVVYTCEGVFEDENKRNECLDILHHLVYESYKEGERSFNDWMKIMSTKYIDYNKAMKTEHPSTPLWVLATLINKNLFGEVKKDIAFQAKITAHIGLFVKHLGKAIKQYDID